MYVARFVRECVSAHLSFHCVLLALLLGPLANLAFASSGCDGAGNCYIRSGATGSGTGADWTNAYTGFGTSAGQINPSSMTRGVTYWIGTGSYDGVTFDSPDTGTQVITLEGVTASSHGPASDWNSSYAGQALFGESAITTDYWTINGQALSGCSYPSNSESCYSIKFWNQTDIAGQIMGLGGISNVKLEYLEMEGTGMTGGAFPNNSTADRCDTDGCGSVSDVGVNEGTAPVSHLYIGYNYIHDIGTNPFMFNVTGSGQSVNQTLTWDHNWVAYNHTGQNGLHTEAGSVYASNFTVSYNVFQDISGSGEISSAGAATPAMSNWAIYGNIFFWDSTYAALDGQYHQATVDDGIIDFLGEQMSGYVYFYNNTIAGLYNTVATSSGTPFSTTAVVANQGYSTCGSTCPTVQIYNNLWWDSAWISGDYPSYCQIVAKATCTQDYDAFYNGSVASGALQEPIETHGVLVANTTNPFVSSSTSTVAGFELATPDPFTSNAGFTLGSPYNVDMLGVSRGADGTWDRGALQMGTGSVAATLQSITVTPANASITANGTQQFTGTGTYSNGSTQNITDSATWTSSNPSVATIANTGLATGLAAGTSTITATSGSVSGATTLTVTAVTLQSITVTPANTSITAGATQQYTATGTYSNGTTQNITSSVTWSSNNSSVATITSTGLASGASAGLTTITAASGSISGSTTLTVTALTLQSITVTPANTSITAGATQQYTATGTYSNGTTQNITSSVTWSSNNSSVATITSTGLASGGSSGLTTITAASGSISGSTTLTVTALTLQSITVTPANTSITAGATQQYMATGTYSNGTTQNITSSVTWSSSNSSVATITSTGLASGVSAGLTTITAASGSISSSTTLTVTAPTLQSITVTPANTSITAGATQQYSATGTYSNGTKQNLTGSAIWSSSNSSIATITSTGLASGGSSGLTTITAASGSVSGSTTLTVTAPTLQSITVTPANTSITAGATQQYTATGTYSNGTTQNITSSVTWSSSNSSVATITSTGLASGASSGLTTITAASGSVSSSTTLTVTAPTLQSITVTPANTSITAGATQQYTATGTYSNGTTQNLTGSAIWSSSNSSVATITSTGLASGASAGLTTITAASGSVASSTTLTVTAPTLQSITITPANSSITAGATQQYTATGTYSNGTTQNITSSVTWSSNNTGVAIISSSGLASAVAAGTSTITATSGSATDSTVVTVTAAIAGTASFTLGASPSTLTIAQGSSGTETITANPANGYTGTIRLTLDFGSADSILENLCGFSANQSVGSITVTGASPVSATFTLNTNASDCANSAAISRTGFHRTNGYSSSKKEGPKLPNPLPAGVSLAGLALIGYFGRRSRKLRNTTTWLTLLSAVLSISACGGTVSLVAANPAPGNYTGTIIGQDSANSSLTSTTTFTLVIQ